MRLSIALIALLVCLHAAAGEKTSVVVAVEANWPPMEYIDESGQVAGFSVDYVNAVAREAGFSVKYVPVSWEEIFDGLLARQYDVIASSVSIIPEREKLMDFSIPYYDVKQAYVTLTANSVRKPADLAGRKVGAQAGTTGDFAARQLDGAEVAAYEEIGQAFEALENGELDGVVADDPIATSYILGMTGSILGKTTSTQKMKVAFILPSDEPEYYGFAVNKGDEKLLDLLNRGIQKVQEKGIDGDLRRKWIGF